MIYVFDPRKNDANVEKHDVPMLDALGFEWESAQVREDKRKTYAERRFEAIGLIEDRLYVLVFCHREALGGAVRRSSGLNGFSKDESYGE